MRVEPATAADAIDIATISVCAWQAGYRGIIPNRVLGAICLDQRVASFQQLISDKSACVIVARRDGRIRGYATFASSRDEDADPETVAELQSMYVDPKCWRTGIGSSLCRSVVEELTDAGFRKCTLWVLERNEAARRFYEVRGVQA